MKKLAIQNLILDDSDVENKIQRIGLEILEDNTHESKITLFGISDNGKLIAEKLKKDRLEAVELYLSKS